MSLAVDDTFFNIEHECTGGLENAQKLLRLWQKPIDVLFRRYAAVGVAPLVSIWRRCKDQINRVIWKRLKNLLAVTFNDDVCLKYWCSCSQTPILAKSAATSNLYFTCNLLHGSGEFIWGDSLLFRSRTSCEVRAVRELPKILNNFSQQSHRL